MTQAHDEKIVEAVARAIAAEGFGRPWDDFYPCSANDTDQGDLTEYAIAALAAARPLLEAEIREKVLRDLCESVVGRRFIQLPNANAYFMMLRVTAKECWGFTHEQFDRINSEVHKLDLTTDSKNGEG